ncbi:hypothetical protein ACIBJC_18930 [Streptomyces sp. NPDC050509]|uniref:hypothetical protein n=1 Tax=Streptomyces sp. NPDC050509 TaxID=3365620 RepID=UPI00378C6C5E
MAELVRLLEVDVPPGQGVRSGWTWEEQARTALRTALDERSSLPEECFDALMKAAVHDPNPSFNRQFVEPALFAFGHRRVQLALLHHLRTGTDPERAGAARAWYWSALPPRKDMESGIPDGKSEAGIEDVADIATAWREAALREFVGNEHLDVRRCILPGLPLYPAAYPPDLRPLVDSAVAIARSHSDAYMRHRVEHQIRRSASGSGEYRAM